MAGVVLVPAGEDERFYDDERFERDLETLKDQPVDGLEEHVKAYVREIDHPILQVVFVRWYASLCRGYGKLFADGIDPTAVFNAGWRRVQGWEHYAEDLTTFVGEHNSFETVNPAVLLALSKNCLKVFVLYDYLMCFDTGPRRDGQMRLPQLNRTFGLLCRLNDPRTYAAARSVALGVRSDGGDNA